MAQNDCTSDYINNKLATFCPVSYSSDSDSYSESESESDSESDSESYSGWLQFNLQLGLKMDQNNSDG